ncbi:hypothetical protein V6N13_149673 [Hibiscus sabdariffa]
MIIVTTVEEYKGYGDRASTCSNFVRGKSTKRNALERFVLICSAKSIMTRLHEWGLGNINIHRMRGEYYHISIEDDELYIMLEDLNWSYLKEIFSEVGPWLESMNRRERATWLEVKGVPLHCWNDTTLKRVAEIWGTFEALGENVSHMLEDICNMGLKPIVESSTPLQVSASVETFSYFAPVLDFDFFVTRIQVIARQNFAKALLLEQHCKELV